MNQADLDRLARLAAMKRDVDLQEVSRIAAEMNLLQRDIDSLRAKVKARDEDLSLDPARLTGVDVAWRQWVDRTIRAHQSRMAELALVREMLVAKARKSFGRADVLNTLNELQQERRRRD